MLAPKGVGPPFRRSPRRVTDDGLHLASMPRGQRTHAAILVLIGAVEALFMTVAQEAVVDTRPVVPAEEMRVRVAVGSWAHNDVGNV